MKFTSAQLVFLKTQFPDFDESDFVAKAEAYVSPKRVANVPQDNSRCEAIKKDGGRCTKKSTIDCLCTLHHKYALKNQPKPEEVAAEPVVERMKCSNHTAKGLCCKRYATTNGMCTMHYKSSIKSDMSEELIACSEPEDTIQYRTVQGYLQEVN